jgi:hypothetical protein
MSKSFEIYMNDPEIANEPLPLREIHAIRLMIRDETKNLTPEERVSRVSAESQELLRHHGITLETVEAKP